MQGREKSKPTTHGPTQRQLRAGELIRHALVEILREHEIHDEALVGVSVTVAEVRMSPDLRHATCFVEPLGGVHSPEVVSALNRHHKFLRGVLGRHIEMKFTPDLRFMHDESFNEAARIEALFEDPRVKRDLEAPDDAAEDENGPDGAS
jgi:ribosome-binding factor A